MTTIHIYCSYKLSPVGYQYGILQYSPDSGSDYTRLSKPEENAATLFVKTAFDHGFIAAVRGKLPVPDSDSYVFLVKRYRYSYPEEHADFGKDVYVNMAFEFDNASEYAHFAKSFLQRLEKEEADLKQNKEDVESNESAIADDLNRKIQEELASSNKDDKAWAKKLQEPDNFQKAVRERVEARQYDLEWKMPLKGEMADLIHPDYDADDYALTIDRQKLKEFMESMLDNQSDTQLDPITNTQFLVSSDQPKYRDELSTLFGLGQPSASHQETAGVILVYGPESGESQDDKKKLLRMIQERPLSFLLLLLVILMVLLGTFLLSNSEKELPNQAEVSVQEEMLPEETELPNQTEVNVQEEALPEETENPEEAESPEETENLP